MVRAQQHLLEAGVRLRVFCARRHGEPADVGDRWRRAELLDVSLELAVVLVERVLVRLQCPRVPGNDLDEGGVVVQAHAAQWRRRLHVRRHLLDGAAMQVVLVEVIVLTAQSYCRFPQCIPEATIAWF